MANNKTRFERISRIKAIYESLLPIKDTYDRRTFVLKLCVKYDIAQRKASEYLKVAEYMLKHGN